MNRLLSPARVFSTAALLLLAVAAPAQDAVPADPVIVSAGSVQVKKSEFDKALAGLPAEYQAYAQGPGKKQFAEDYLRMRLLADAGAKAGLDKSPAVVEQLELMKLNLIATEQMKRMEEGLKLNDEELKQSYDQNVANYATAKASHILIAFEGSPAAQSSKPKLTDEQAKAKAEKIRADIVGGASFTELAKKESDDVGSGAEGGSLGEFGRGQMVPEFESAVFEGKVGEVSPVIRTQFGYHVIRVDERSTAAFDSVKPKLEKEARQKALQKAVDNLRGGEVKFDEAFFGKPTEAPKE